MIREIKNCNECPCYFCDLGEMGIDDGHWCGMEGVTGDRTGLNEVLPFTKLKKYEKAKRQNFVKPLLYEVSFHKCSIEGQNLFCIKYFF